MGPRDVQQETCVVSRRDQPGKQGKQFGVPLEPHGFIAHVQGLLDDIQNALYAEVCPHGGCALEPELTLSSDNSL